MDSPTSSPATQKNAWGSPKPPVDRGAILSEAIETAAGNLQRPRGGRPISASCRWPLVMQATLGGAGQEGEMSHIDVVIPAIVGLVALVRPQLMFYGSRVTPDKKKIRMLRGIGVILLIAALIYLGIKLATA